MKSSDNGNMPKLAAYKECTGCFACATVCSKSAIETFINGEGHYAVRVNVDKCIHCGKCERVCKSSRSSYGCNDLKLSNVFAGYTTDDQLRQNATSGGVFAALAKKILEDGGVVAGASFDGTYAKHILIDRVEDIAKLQGSKYTPSSMEGIYKEIEKELPRRKVLFSGTGCQVAGILAYFDGKKYSDNLYTVDLVCGGVPSTELVKRFNDHNKCMIRSFRSKDKYELIVDNNNGDGMTIHGKTLPLDGFVYGMTNRLSCYDCKFSFCHRKSDITIGDLWDYSILPTEHKKGISMVLIHTDKGLNLSIQNHNIYLEEISWTAIKKNYRVAYGKERMYHLRKKLATNLKKMDYFELMKSYAFDFRPIDMRHCAFKLYRYLLYRRDEKNRIKYIDRILDKYKK